MKAYRTNNLDSIPSKVLGGAWRVQNERMDAEILIPLFLTLIAPSGREFAIQYLSANLPNADLFVIRIPVSPSARRAGWQGFIYHLQSVKDAIVKLVEVRSKTSVLQND